VPTARRAPQQARRRQRPANSRVLRLAHGKRRSGRGAGSGQRGCELLLALPGPPTTTK